MDPAQSSGSQDLPEGMRKRVKDVSAKAAAARQMGAGTKDREDLSPAQSVEDLSGGAGDVGAVVESNTLSGDEERPHPEAKGSDWQEPSATLDVLLSSQVTLPTKSSFHLSNKTMRKYKVSAVPPLLLPLGKSSPIRLLELYEALMVLMEDERNAVARGVYSSFEEEYEAADFDHAIRDISTQMRTRKGLTMASLLYTDQADSEGRLHVIEEIKEKGGDTSFLISTVGARSTLPMSIRDYEFLKRIEKIVQDAYTDELAKVQGRAIQDTSARVAEMASHVAALRDAVEGLKGKQAQTPIIQPPPTPIMPSMRQPSTRNYIMELRELYLASDAKLTEETRARIVAGEKLPRAHKKRIEGLAKDLRPKSYKALAEEAMGA